jgi:putative endonuclease
MKFYWVYILCSKRNGTLYIGLTNDLARRIFEHKEKLIDGFTRNYNVTSLVYVEGFNNINDAIQSEKCIKKWHRSWKLRLIEKHNPEWKDLYENFL